MRPLIGVGSTLLLFSLTFAGCLDTGPAYAAATVPQDAPSIVGDGDFAVKVEVRAEFGGGAPLAGAPVVVHPIEKPHSAPSIPELLGKNTTLAGRTGPDGVLIAKLDLGKSYTFITATPNWTVESRHIVKITQDLRDKPLVITVFKPSAEVALNGKVPMVLRTESPICCVYQTSGRWWLQELRFHEDNASQRQYLYRLRDLQATLTFTPPAGSSANLNPRAVIYSDGAAPIVLGSGSSGGIGNTGSAVTRPLRVYPWELANLQAVKNPVLKIGVMTFDSVITPECVPWEFKITAAFDSRPPPPAHRPTNLYGGSVQNPIPELQSC